MPVKRALRLEKENETPAKRPAPDRNYSPVTGTCSLASTPVPPGKGKTGYPSEIQNAPADAEKSDVPRSKTETLLKIFQKAKLHIEKALPMEGSSELRSFFTRGSADLEAELCKHRELGASVGTCLSVTDFGQCPPVQGFEKQASSYEFLKSILN
ncbi:centromere protein R [Scleropages formosus]|uniref:centromere protein R n=1 Tax=Scleropages formosus TaxID=113540 RepID=UPI000878FCCE|nr:centromere protein R [Scleropages formosus]